jgi:Zn-dependent peptidase ImmA (M78 family)/DNA-binding XRE family transcriptional regulator
MNVTKTTDPAFVTPSVIRWAIARASTTPEKLAKRLHATRTAIAAWEQGDSLPSFSQAQKLAEALYIPFGYLFLPNPPNETIPITDFRAAPGKRIRPSADLVDLVNDVIFKHQWYRDFIERGGAVPLPFVGRFSAAANGKVSADISKALRVEEIRQRCTGPDEFYRGLIRSAEAEGILVMRTGIVAGNTRRKLSVKEFRGFAISDPIAPLIFINTKDWLRSQIFTLAHELAHIWIGKTGISNEAINVDANNPVEQFCNNTAADVLVPASEFGAVWDEPKPIAAKLEHSARHFKVSTLVVLRRAYDLQRIVKTQYLKLYEQEERSFQKPGSQRRGGGSFYNNVIARNSPTLTKVVVQGAVNGKVLYRDAARLLNINASAVQKVSRHLIKAKEGG